MTNSKIEWTETTWNPLTGCTKISPGCANCYAERMALRLQAMGSENYSNGFELTIHEHMLDAPLNWKKPRMVFVNSMSDLFHVEVPDDFIHKVFAAMNRAHQHTFQVLTKRSTRLAELAPEIEWPANVWMGVSIESQDYVYRIHNLLQCNAAVKFLSLEPLLGPIPNLPLNGVDWVIVGGESGPGARHMEPDWALSLLRQCQQADAPFFFKQWGGTNKKKTGRILADQFWDEMPSPTRPAFAV